MQMMMTMIMMMIIIITTIMTSDGDDDDDDDDDDGSSIYCKDDKMTLILITKPNKYNDNSQINDKNISDDDDNTL